MPVSWLTFVNVKTTEAARRAALAARPLEALAAPDDTPLAIAAGRQTRGALPLSTDRFEGAVYSSRGRGYARYNEDAAGLYADERGSVYACVFDQAGGLGGTVRGAASALAAHAAFTGFQAIAQAGVDVPQQLRKAVFTAHEDLVARNQGEVTTAVLVVARPNSAVLVNSGDSAAMHFDETGALQSITEKHELESPQGIACLVHGIGLLPEGPAPDIYEWPLKAGDWLLLGSDGLLDAGLAPSALGAIVANAPSAEVAVNLLARQILRRMTLLQAKPDNLTIVALRAR